jgi:transcriptional antiterminator RfaH
MDLPRKWYAAYTHPRQEKKIASDLTNMGIENYLPLTTTLRQWSDRRKKVVEPMIRSYIFVHVSEQEMTPVRFVPGVVRYIPFRGKPVSIPDYQIQNLRILEGSELPFTPENQMLVQGEKVRIIAGPLTGLRGTIVRTGNKSKLWISITALHYHLTVDIVDAYVEKDPDQE